MIQAHLSLGRWAWHSTYIRLQIGLLRELHLRPPTPECAKPKEHRLAVDDLHHLAILRLAVQSLVLSSIVIIMTIVLHYSLKRKSVEIYFFLASRCYFVAHA